MVRDKTVNDCVEALCRAGCTAVRATIQTLENDLPVSQVAGLSDAEKRHVLEELRAIMAVYDARRD